MVINIIIYLNYLTMLLLVLNKLNRSSFCSSAAVRAREPVHRCYFSSCTREVDGEQSERMLAVYVHVGFFFVWIDESLHLQRSQARAIAAVVADDAVVDH
jgi:hypothetical protein